MKKLKLKTGSFHFAENRKFLLCLDRQKEKVKKRGVLLFPSTFSLPLCAGKVDKHLYRCYILNSDETVKF